LSDSKSEIISIAAENDDLKHKNNELDGLLSESKSQAISFAAENHDLRNKARELDQLLSDSKLQVSSLTAENDDLNYRNSEVDELRLQVLSLTAENEILRNTKDALQSKVVFLSSAPPEGVSTVQDDTLVPFFPEFGEAQSDVPLVISSEDDPLKTLFSERSAKFAALVESVNSSIEKQFQALASSLAEMAVKLTSRRQLLGSEYETTVKSLAIEKQTLVELTDNQIAEIGRLTNVIDKLAMQLRGSQEEVVKLREGLAMKNRAVEVEVTPPPAMKHREPENDVLIAYLKQVLLQFFFQNDTARGALIPVILELVQANQEEIMAAKRQWETSQQLITKALGVFGL
jgi:chromosome segregation ATPase